MSLQEVTAAYEEAVRNCSPEQRRALEEDPRPRPDDRDAIRKELYRRLRYLSCGETWTAGGVFVPS